MNSIARLVATIGTILIVAAPTLVFAGHMPGAVDSVATVESVRA